MKQEIHSKKVTTVERQLSELIKTRGGSDNRTTCNIMKIHDIQFTDIVIYCILLALAV